MKKVVIHLSDEHVATLVGLVSDIADVILVKRLVEEEQAQPAPANGAEKLLELRKSEIVHVVGRERSRSSPGAIERIARDLQSTAQSLNAPVKLVEWRSNRPYPHSTVYTAVKWAQRKGVIRVDMRDGVQWLVPTSFTA
jgi:hypothetical protein